MKSPCGSVKIICPKCNTTTEVYDKNKKSALKRAVDVWNKELSEGGGCREAD